MTRTTVRIARLLGVLLLAATPAAAQQASEEYEALYLRYLEQARSQQARAATATWMTSLMTDLRARQVNDLVTVRVVESMAAVGAADASVSKTGSAGLSLPSLFGLESALPSVLDPANLVTGSNDTDFSGGGSTARTGELVATLTARVAEVLPNGDLVLEGVREININGDRQIVVLTGVVRTADILPGNVVSSASIGQLRIQYVGHGLIRDSLSPGWLARVLNKIF